jgi:tRNA (guanine-N7-)-methyltransferase
MNHLARPIMSKTMLRSFGRVRGRILGDTLKQIVDDKLPALLIPEDTTDPMSLFDHAPQEIRVEIGFGSGEHLVHMAKQFPHIGFIGCEPYLNGVAASLQLMEQEKVTNIRIWRGDARLLLAQLPAASISKIFILFPDPWPKRKHHKKRLISGKFPALLSYVLKPGGTVLLATDHVDYAGWMLSFMLRERSLVWQAKVAKDWETPPTGWTPTRYQEKALRQGREAVFFDFVREKFL